MSHCNGCKTWTVKRRRVFDDDTEIVLFDVGSGKGFCELLACETNPEFGCNQYQSAPGYDHVVTELVQGAAWQAWKMGQCPDCSGRGCGLEGGACWRCAGTGKVRYYADGVVGDERTRKHPIEVERDREELCVKLRHDAEALLNGVPSPEIIDPTALKPMPKPSVL